MALSNEQPSENTNLSTSSDAACLTAEKSLKSDKDTHTSAHFTAIITCPDGSKVNLTSDCNTKQDETISSIILGRGKHGVPESATNVSGMACVIRIRNHALDLTYGKSQRKIEPKYGMELVVVGSHPCRVTRKPLPSDVVPPADLQSKMDKSANENVEEEDRDNVVGITSFLVCSPLTQNELGFTTCSLIDGDVVEPYLQEDREEDFGMSERYFPFEIQVIQDGRDLIKRTTAESALIESSNKIMREDKDCNKGLAGKSSKENMLLEQEVHPSEDTVAGFDKAMKNKPLQMSSATTGNKEAVKGISSAERPIEISQIRSKETAVGQEEGANKSEGMVGMRTTTIEGRAQVEENMVIENVDTVKSTSSIEQGKKTEEAQKDKNIENEKIEVSKKGCKEDLSHANTEAKKAEGNTSKPSHGVPSTTKPEETSVADTPIEKKEEATDKSKKNADLKTTKEEDPVDISSSSKDSIDEDDYDFDDPREEVLEMLESIDSPGTFAVGGSCCGHLTMPGLDVDGVGTIALPLTKVQVQSLSSRCEQAPFGWGSKTLVDKSVRNTFQLSPDSFKITNPYWTGEVETLASNVCKELGVQPHLKVEAQLYKLLLYETGSFFSMHRDSEKVDGMFGTLVIVLPSAFTGGELVVKHGGEVKEFAQSSSSSFGSQYVSFYADCKHELKIVTGGYRLCLVYNLVKVGLGSCPRANEKSEILGRLKAAAHAWGENYCGKKLVIMTKHLYTPAGMAGGGSSGTNYGGGSTRFKGKDAAVVEILELAVEKGLDLDWDHGTVSFSETGYGEGYGDYYGGGFTWEETTDSEMTLTLSSWGAVSICQEEEMIPDDFYEDEDGDETFEPTGNEGVNAERQYADEDAIVVWPRSQRWTIITNNDLERMCLYLFKACTPGTNDSEPKADCIAKAKTVIRKMISSSSSSYSSNYGYNNSGKSQSNVSALLKSLVCLGDQKLALESFLGPYVTSKNGTPDLILEELLLLVERFGSDAVRPYLLATVDERHYAHNPTKAANFVLECWKLLHTKPLYAALANEMVNRFVDVMCPADSNDWCTLSKNLNSFPLKDLLALFYGEQSVPDGLVLAKRVIVAIVCASCEPSQEMSHYSYCRRTAQLKGSNLLLEARIAELCESLGWKEFEVTLTEAVDKLCTHGRIDTAVELVEKMMPLSSSKDASSERSQACKAMASVVCKAMLNSSNNMPASNKTSSADKTLATQKRLFKMIGQYCPSQISDFVTAILKLDVDTILVPFVMDAHKQAAACSPELQKAVTSIAKHCFDVIASRNSAPLGNIQVWTLPAKCQVRNPLYSSFLTNPCKQVKSWQAKKSDHQSYFTELAPLIRKGEVKAETYQPGGTGRPYHFKITKLKIRSIPLENCSNLTCDCSSGNRHTSSRYGHGYGLPTSNCFLKKHQATLAKCKQDEKTLSTLTRFLPPGMGDKRDSRKRHLVTDNIDLTSSSATDPTAAVAVAAMPQPTKKQKQVPNEVIDLT